LQKGKIQSHKFESTALKDNPLGDPFIRDVLVYTPAGYSSTEQAGYTAVFYLAGYGGTGIMMLNADPFSENMAQRMDRLVSESKCSPMIIVLVDGFTRFGGNQYINSEATGMYEDYIVKELIPFIRREYNVANCAIMGHSSGGYGSLVLGMRHPDVFQALADHSGDSAFEYCYLPDFPKALEVFRKAGGPAKWFESFWSKPDKYQNRDDLVALNILGMAAHYSPNPKSPLSVDLPFDLDTGEMRQDVWNRWLASDPVRMLEDQKYCENLKRLKLVYIDCGTRDEYNMQWGCRMVHAKLARGGVPHYYEEHSGGHRKIDHRYDVSLAKISGALGGQDGST